MGEVVEDFQGQEEAGRVDVFVPLEDGLVDDLDVSGVSAFVEGGEQVLLLHFREGRGDFNDFELGALVDFGV